MLCSASVAAAARRAIRHTKTNEKREKKELVFQVLLQAGLFQFGLNGMQGGLFSIFIGQIMVFSSPVIEKCGGVWKPNCIVSSPVSLLQQQQNVVAGCSSQCGVSSIPTTCSIHYSHSTAVPNHTTQIALLATTPSSRRDWSATSKCSTRLFSIYSICK